jgi:Tfp pilus assembly protein PilO
VKRSVLIGAVAGGVALILLWYFVLFAPTSSDLSDTRGQVAAAQSQKQELENTIAHLKELSANAAQQQASLRTLRAAIPPTPDLGAFILAANDIATSTGIDWLSIAPTAPTATVGPGPTSTIGLSMPISGGFFEVLDYLNHLEDLERVVVVDTINVAAVGADSGSTGAGTGSSGATGASSSGGAPDLNVTLTGRMFTNATPAAVPGSTITPGTPATTPTTVPGSSTGSTTPPASSSGSSS